ncbi:MAG TPA: energy transducer TonB [Gammaproteobacteria bacterium]|nr:energy transducer TonB [Gammaproteobacteria bacterium]
MAEAIGRATACLGQKDAACAETAVASVQALNDDERALLAITRADLAALREDSGAGVSILREALALAELSDPVQREITWRLALLHNRRAEFAETLRLSASIGCDKWTPEALALRAMAYQELGARAAALESYEAAMRLYELEGEAVPNVFKVRYETLLTSEPPTPTPGTDVVALVRENPDYPLTALQRGISGWVLLEFDVTENGAVANTRVVRSTNEVFDEVSIATVQRWRYAPDFENGVPVGYTHQTVLQFCREPCNFRRNPLPQRGPDGRYVLP